MNTLIVSDVFEPYWAGRKGPWTEEPAGKRDGDKVAAEKSERQGEPAARRGEGFRQAA